jgi:predicted esterase
MRAPEKQTVHFDFSAPYYKLGSVNDKTTQIWMIFHGYGQLVEHFYIPFSRLHREDQVFIFPQALSKFYLKGVSEKIGASWMTAHDRDTDIRNYLHYLDKLYFLEIEPGNKKLNILGFSQGVHTASRWIGSSGIRYHKFVSWGADLAREIDAGIITQSFGGENHFVVGDQDKYIDANLLQRIEDRYQRIGFKYSLLHFCGKHEIDPAVLESLLCG